MKNRLLKFDSVFIKLFASVMLALILFAFAMVILTHLVHDTSANTRHQVIASQVTQQIEPLLQELRESQQTGQNLESRYLLALIRRSFGVYSESLNAKFGLYDANTQQAILLMHGLPPTLPPKPPFLSTLLPHDDPNLPTQVQINSQSGYVLFYQSNLSKKHPISPTINLITGTLLLLLIMSGMLWVIARTMTWRINQLSKQITQLGNGDFSVRVTPVGNDEITILARGFNQTAERIETLMNANKLLLAHASHEIRTPITRIRLQVEMMSMLAHQLDPKAQEKFDKRATAINRDLTGLNDLVESILLVSRMDAGHAIEKMAQVDLYQLIKNEVQHYPQASFNGSHLRIEGQSGLLTHMIRNLLDNAHLHGVPPVAVELYAIDEAGNILDLPMMTYDKGADEDKADEDKTYEENDTTLTQSEPVSSTDIELVNSEPTVPTATDITDSTDNTESEPSQDPTLQQDKADKHTETDTLNLPTTTKSTKETRLDKLLPKSKPIRFSRKKVDTPTPPNYQRIRIAIIDQGTGIPLEKRREIFSPFVRLQQEKKGSGLGLSLVSQIVTAHNGTIITDTLNGHTRFLITLPVKQQQMVKKGG
ncbi:MULTISPECIES: sensor histidine kinase [unclassified Moraxella]|uniref:sensor histidine kinase n=1 Tax=unclassified Moraxella TaxID=2685852 RepID=UPI003AF83E6D